MREYLWKKNTDDILKLDSNAIYLMVLFLYILFLNKFYLRFEILKLKCLMK